MLVSKRQAVDKLLATHFKPSLICAVPYIFVSFYMVWHETHLTLNLRCVKEWVAPPSEVLLSSTSKTRVPLALFMSNLETEQP